MYICASYSSYYKVDEFYPSVESINYIKAMIHAKYGSMKVLVLYGLIVL